MAQITEKAVVVVFTKENMSILNNSTEVCLKIPTVHSGTKVGKCNLPGKIEEYSMVEYKYV